MIPRPCIECPRLINGGSRCPGCQSRYEARRGTPAERGYDAEWRRLSEQETQRVGRCQRCGTTGTADNPLTLDHVYPKSRGGENGPTQVLCRRCNSSKGVAVA